MPKHTHIYKFFVLFILLTAILSYYSCRKDSKTQSSAITDPAIAQAKTWYDAVYPQSSTAANASQTKTTYSVNNPAVDLSQHARPDWQHSSKYVRFNKNVIEMPIDPANNSSFSIRNGPAGRDYANNSYSRSYFLLISNGKSYQAFLMTVIADSSYVKNDLSKLGNNTYRKHDADFSGLVLYFTPKGQYVSGYRYANGQLVVPGTSSATTNAVNSSNRGVKVDTETVCTDWYLVTWYGDEIIDVEYEYSECSSGASADGTGGSGTTTPPPCPAATTGGSGGSVGLNSIRNPVIYTKALPGPASGDDGGYPDPTTNPCEVVTVPIIDTINIIFCSGLTPQEQNSIRSTVKAFSTEDCASRYLYSYFSGQTISFCIGLPMGNADFNPATGGFTFANDQMATPVNADLLEHEFFHDYQNSTYPGGINTYGETTTGNNPGAVNIEFEQAVFNDIATGGRSAFSQGSDDQQKQYDIWISSLTNNGTAYPQLSPGTAAYSQFLTSYNSFLSEYNQIPGNEYSSTIISLTPQALINLFNIVTTPNC